MSIVQHLHIKHNIAGTSNCNIKFATCSGSHKQGPFPHTWQNQILQAIFLLIILFGGVTLTTLYYCLFLHVYRAFYSIFRNNSADPANNNITSNKSLVPRDLPPVISLSAGSHSIRNAIFIKGGPHINTAYNIWATILTNFNLKVPISKC